jgi:membrane-associated protein
MISLGVMCHLGFLNLHLAGIMAIVASIIGANAGYTIGRYTLGNIISRRERFIFLSRATIERGINIAEQHGAKLIVPAMFVGGFWALTSLIPGVVRMKYSRFAVVNALGLVLWVSVLMCMGYFGGYVWSSGVMGKRYIGISVIAVVVVSIIIWKFVVKRMRN